MKDLDFDELDRAVNSLATNAPGSDASTKNKETTTPPTVRPSTGQFMDVVHPSSNMRASLVMPERASHQGVTVTPIVPTTKTPIVPDNTSAIAPTNSMPDPIDFAGFNNDGKDKDKVPDKEEDDADIDQISDDITNTLNPKSDKSMDSPFLSGTKVDKRPLGTFSSDTPLTSPVQPPVQEAKPEETTNTNMAAQPASVITPLPAELQNDLLLVESDSTTRPDGSNTTATKPTIVTNNTPAIDDKPVGPTSITQQYKEQPSSGDQNTGAIYDTKEYHKSLLYPAKKKSSWIWVLWIVILLVVGAGAGAAVYFFVLPK